nr:SseB family protein [Pseudactinotalea sp. HY160]
MAAAFATEQPHRLGAIVEALREARLLIPVVANLDEMEAPEFEGQVVGEKSAHAAMVTVAAPDGRGAIPVFSSVAALTAWRADARPVPVEARKAALAAGTEADSLLVLDPGSDHTTLVPSHAVAAIATGEPWSNPLVDPEVHQAIAGIVESIPAAVRAEIRPGTGAEIRIVLALRPGLDRVGVISASQQASAALGASTVVTARVDSLELRITTATDAEPA